MWQDRVSDPGPLALESDALSTAQRGRGSNKAVLVLSREQMGNYKICLHDNCSRGFCKYAWLASNSIPEWKLKIQAFVDGQNMTMLFD